MSYSLKDLLLKSTEFLDENQFKISVNEKIRYVKLSIKSVIHKGDNMCKLI